VTIAANACLSAPDGFSPSRGRELRSGSRPYRLGRSTIIAKSDMILTTNDSTSSTTSSTSESEQPAQRPTIRRGSHARTTEREPRSAPVGPADHARVHKCGSSRLGAWTWPPGPARMTISRRDDIRSRQAMAPGSTRACSFRITPLKASRFSPLAASATPGAGCRG